ncbi:MAG: hypothetical protein KAW12_27325 [Candidatus Aminicenantes bacterium]|nr:hypothetical protein [Candidatus Aminicenantes bacterium]
MKKKNRFFSKLLHDIDKYNRSQRSCPGNAPTCRWEIELKKNLLYNTAM